MFQEFQTNIRIRNFVIFILAYMFEFASILLKTHSQFLLRLACIQKQNHISLKHQDNSLVLWHCTTCSLVGQFFSSSFRSHNWMIGKNKIFRVSILFHMDRVVAVALRVFIFFERNIGIPYSNFISVIQCWVC